MEMSLLPQNWTNDYKQSRLTSMNVNESAAASTKVVGAAAIISRALYRVLTEDG